MPRARKRASDFAFEPERSGGRAQLSLARRTLVEVNRARAEEAHSVRDELRGLRDEYRDAIAELIGPAGMRRLRKLGSDRSGASRAQIIRRTRTLLRNEGVDQTRLQRIQERYEQEARAIISAFDGPARHRPLDGGCDGPWVTYSAPFGGYAWAYAWERTANPSNPVLISHLDAQAARVGSSIQAKVSGAGDDDFLSASYYTGLNRWHTALDTGPLEVYLGFEFNASTYSGKVTDEFGFSFAVYHQWAGARLTAVGAQGGSESQRSRILAFIGVAWGENDSWDYYAEKPRDMHWYHFRTTTSFQQGEAVLLEGGVENMTWFEANDQSIAMADDVNLRLDRIMVRSCRPDPVLLRRRRRR